jgi:hypothetical protein
MKSKIQKLAVDIAAFDADVGAEVLRLTEVLAFVSNVKTAAADFSRNLVTNGPNLWTFTILPYFPVKRAYREDINCLVIRPAWRPLEASLGKIASSYPTVATTVDRELSWMAQQFNIEIPQNIRTILVAHSQEQAEKRWGMDPLMIKERLIPLDGALPRDVL